jgi:hypothetical protein
MNQNWGPSYRRGVRLVKAGCELPYLKHLPGRERFLQRALYVSPVGGYFGSCAIDNGIWTGYIIALRVATDRSRGAVVTSFEFVPPWPGHEIDWDYDLESVMPKSKLHIYEEFIGSRLPAVLKERTLLSRGRPVDGLLCGGAGAPIPKDCQRDVPAMALITLVDDLGECVVSDIDLRIYSLMPKTSELRRRTRHSRLQIASV